MSQAQSRKRTPLDLSGAAFKVKRAEQHLHNLAALIADYRASDPYEIRREEDPESGQVREIVTAIKKPLPIDAAAVIGDCIHNLRAAYDFIAYAIRRKDRVAFPVIDVPDTKKLESEIRRIMKADATRAVIDLIKRCEPYKGGNSPIWVLHRLDRVDKHRLLLAADMATAGLFGTFNWPADWGDDLEPIRVAIADKDPSWVEPGTEIRTEMGQEMKVEFKTPFAIALKEPKIIGPEPIGPFLLSAIKYTNTTIEGFGTALFGGPPPNL
jgi:hypothetical protein